MSIKLSQSDRRQIITDHLNGIPNELYYVITTSNGTYQVRRKNASPNAPNGAQTLCAKEEPSTQSSAEPLTQSSTQSSAEPSTHSHNEITNDQVLGRLKEMMSQDGSDGRTTSERPFGAQAGDEHIRLQPRRRILRL